MNLESMVETLQEVGSEWHLNRPLSLEVDVDGLTLVTPDSHGLLMARSFWCS